MADSGPTSPSANESIQDVEDDTYTGNGLKLELGPFEVEHIYDYEPGGHHPVHLGDCLGDGDRYQVLHKLGHGGFANVWLCRDKECETPKYVAVKILVAEASADDCSELRVKYLKESNVEREPGGDAICLPLTQFRVEGPNGSHICLVYPVLGPQVSRILKDFEHPDQTLRKVSFQAAQAIAVIHRHGMCHGDFTPTNILLRVDGLDGLPEEELMSILGQPQRNSVLTESDEPHTLPTAPQYLVRGIDFNKADIKRFLTDKACIIDFGESYDISNPPQELGVPEIYRPPELILDGKAGTASDIWALGCTIFEIRTGRKLFPLFDDDVESHLYQMVLLLGPLPEPWWTTWEGRKCVFEDNLDSEGRALKATHIVEFEKTRPGMAPIPRSIKDTLADGLCYEYMENGVDYNISRPIMERELELLADLLGRILAYKPEQRITAEEVLNHEWFNILDGSSSSEHGSGGHAPVSAEAHEDQDQDHLECSHKRKRGDSTSN